MGIGIIEPFGGVELEYVGTTVPVGITVGMRVTGKDGKFYRFMKNATGGTCTRYLAYIIRYNSTTSELEVKAAGDDALAGAVAIPQFANVANGSYAWFGTGGLLVATSATALASANLQVSLSTTDGKLDDAAITGKALNAFASDATVGAGDVNFTIYCPGELTYFASN